MKHSQLTGAILSCFYVVYNNLGYGFLEKVYERALLMELRDLGLNCTAQEPLPVYYNSVIVGRYFADIVVEGRVIIELKAASGIVQEHESQLLNYLKASDIEIGLLLNFGIRPQFKRKIVSN